jgi:uncharacterized protein YdeI (YjbR/CyaY-like superfamily)
MNQTSVDSYLLEGCGRCSLYRTPECKVHRWTDALIVLRQVLLESELVEEMKWGAPCYTLDGKNVAMMAALKDSCTLSFFKGAALTDDEGVLESPGPNSRHARLLRFRSAEEVDERRSQVQRYVQQAIEAERSGLEVVLTDEADPLPEELEQRLASDPLLKKAFESLTPGRRRSHSIYVAGAKQSETRKQRVERCVPKIFSGKGFNER